VLADLDEQIDELEDAILQRPTDQQLGQLFDMKRWLIALRKVVDPQTQEESEHTMRQLISSEGVPYIDE
jgi:Mg2+ and Co2+ transporter CorA